MTFLKLKICTMKVDFIVSQRKNIQLIQKYTNRMSKNILGTFMVSTYIHNITFLTFLTTRHSDNKSLTTIIINKYKNTVHHKIPTKTDKINTIIRIIRKTSLYAINEIFVLFGSYI